MAIPGRDLPPEDVRWIERLFSYGFSWRKIKRTTGLSFTAIARVRKRLRKEVRKRRWQKAKEEAAAKKTAS